MVFAITCDIFTARCADFGAFDNGLGIIAAGRGDFCGISGLLFDILLGIIRVDLAFGNTTQAAVKVLTCFIIDAAQALEVFRIGVAITVYDFNGSSGNACAENLFPARGFFVIICSISAAIGSIIYAACCVLRAACCVPSGMKFSPVMLLKCGVQTKALTRKEECMRVILYLSRDCIPPVRAIG